MRIVRITGAQPRRGAPLLAAIALSMTLGACSIGSAIGGAVGTVVGGVVDVVTP